MSVYRGVGDAGRRVGVGDGVAGVGEGVTGVGVGDGVVGVGVGDGVVGVAVGVVGVGVGVSGTGWAATPLEPSMNHPTRTAQLKAAQLMIIHRVGLVLCIKLVSSPPGRPSLATCPIVPEKGKNRNSTLGWL